eukprot:4815929-Alexandrium_andersonii.AAC.1
MCIRDSRHTAGKLSETLLRLLRRPLGGLVIGILAVAGDVLALLALRGRTARRRPELESQPQPPDNNSQDYLRQA